MSAERLLILPETKGVGPGRDPEFRAVSLTCHNSTKLNVVECKNLDSLLYVLNALDADSYSVIDFHGHGAPGLLVLPGVFTLDSNTIPPLLITALARVLKPGLSQVRLLGCATAKTSSGTELLKEVRRLLRLEKPSLYNVHVSGVVDTMVFGNFDTDGFLDVLAPVFLYSTAEIDSGTPLLSIAERIHLIKSD
jgi:hypothetical protein